MSVIEVAVLDCKCYAGGGALTSERPAPDIHNHTHYIDSASRCKRIGHVNIAWG